MLHELLQGALPLLIAGLATPTILGGYRWLRAVSQAVGKLTEVSEQLGAVTEAQAALSRQIRATDRRLALHLRECDQAGAARIPRPRAVDEAAEV